MKLGTFRGIGVYIHWTFWLLIAVYLFSAVSSSGWAAGITAVGFVLCIFFCVLLHEFGHALAAARFGIPTADITLLPIGGMARLARLPDKPYQELVIAVAGPLVNVAIAGLLLVPIGAGLSTGLLAPGLGGGADFLAQLLVVNLALVIFNMLPAFPMDGGRVLRSLLAMRLGQLRATEIAARVGRWMALAFGLFGVIYWHLGLILIAGFIFIAGTAELMGVRARSWASQQYPPQATGWQFHSWRSDRTGDTPDLRGSAPRSDEPDIIDAVEVRRLPDEFRDER